MAKTHVSKVSLKPIVAKLDQLEKAARKAKKTAKATADKHMLGVRVNKIRRAKKALRGICKAFNI